MTALTKTRAAAKTASLPAGAASGSSPWGPAVRPAASPEAPAANITLVVRVKLGSKTICEREAVKTDPTTTYAQILCKQLHDNENETTLLARPATVAIRTMHRYQLTLLLQA